MRRADDRSDGSAITALGVVAPPPLHIESPKFEGSLALLFQVAREHKVNLLDVPLAPICEAYFLYLINLADEDLDEAAAALIALAYLLERKAWALLPLDEPEPEPEEAPILGAMGGIERYDPVIEALQLFSQERAQVFYRTDECADVYELPFSIGDLSVRDLAEAFQRIVEKATRKPVTAIHHARRSLAEMMRLVEAALPENLTPLEHILPDGFTIEDACYWFLSILELIRLGRAILRKEDSELLFARGVM